MERLECEKIIEQKLTELIDIVKEYDKDEDFRLSISITDDYVMAFNHTTNVDTQIDLYIRRWGDDNTGYIRRAGSTYRKDHWRKGSI